MPSTVRVRPITSFNLALPAFERCGRPTAASFKAAGVQPGRLAQGPEEKQAFCGRRRGACDEWNKRAFLSCCSACRRWREYWIDIQVSQNLMLRLTNPVVPTPAAQRPTN